MNNNWATTITEWLEEEVVREQEFAKARDMIQELGEEDLAELWSQFKSELEQWAYYRLDNHPEFPFQSNEQPEQIIYEANELGIPYQDQWNIFYRELQAVYSGKEAK